MYPIPEVRWLATMGAKDNDERERDAFIRRHEREFGIPLGILLCISFGIRDGLSSVLSWWFVVWVVFTLFVSVVVAYAMARALWWFGMR
jgi:hypothetical protein